jgi:hypothetical protein
MKKYQPLTTSNDYMALARAGMQHPHATNDKKSLVDLIGRALRDDDDGLGCEGALLGALQYVASHRDVCDKLGPELIARTFWRVNSEGSLEVRWSGTGVVLALGEASEEEKTGLCELWQGWRKAGLNHPLVLKRKDGVLRLLMDRLLNLKEGGTPSAMPPEVLLASALKLRGGFGPDTIYPHGYEWDPLTPGAGHCGAAALAAALLWPTRVTVLRGLVDRRTHYICATSYCFSPYAVTHFDLTADQCGLDPNTLWEEIPYSGTWVRQVIQDEDTHRRANLIIDRSGLVPAPKEKPPTGLACGGLVWDPASLW